MHDDQHYEVRPMAHVFGEMTEAGEQLMKKVAARKREMGRNFLCHPDNAIRKKPPTKRIIAWEVPSLVSFKGAVATDLTPEQQKQLEGTVKWSLSLVGDAPSVVDRFGKTHKPRALVYADEQNYLD